MTESQTDQMAPANPAVLVKAIKPLAQAGGGSVALTILCWMGYNLQVVQQNMAAINTQVAKVTTTLELVNPKDIDDSLDELKSKALTRDSVRQIVQEAAPWVRDKPDVMARLRRLESKLGALPDP